MAAVVAAACGNAEGDKSNAAGTGGAAGGAHGGAAGSSGVAGEGITLAGFREAFVRAACENLFSCTFGGDAHSTRFLVQTPDRCRDFFDRAHGHALQWRIDAVGRGRASFEPVEARRCLDVLAKSCVLFEAEEPLDAFYGPCVDVFLGNVAQGRSCASDEDCTRGSFCSNEASQPLESTCLGTCVAVLAPGSPCESNQRCAANGDDMAACRDGVCKQVHLATPVQQGQPCGIVEQGANELSVVGCTGSSWCNANATGQGTCTAPLAVGDLCMSENPLCTAGLCLRSGTACAAAKLQGSEGAPCREAEHEFCDSLLGLDCGTTEHCERVAPPSCLDSVGCPAGQFCDELQQCVALKPAGSECRFASECLTGLCEPSAPNEPSRCHSPFCSDW
jgi:hypothetical protein